MPVLLGDSIKSTFNPRHYGIKAELTLAIYGINTILKSSNFSIHRRTP
ncbi:hypothetical protein NBRC3293_2496 [Gluconobacter oxydans NBRC 3293]|uniref:Uncharacterized protein n=1 Tax=Gluconobacter oxydans NBRC 3293 TaxID=1315969 RepID=A0A829X991_GLUOY|nr:hypothetical protein NBRC3293_2496 [Gluconobacter oxydans NBRC 3293]